MLNRIICLSFGLVLVSLFNFSFAQETYDLVYKKEPYPKQILYILFLAIGIVSVAKAVKPALFTSLNTAVFNNGSVTQSIKDGFSPLNSGGLLLLLNYFVLLLTGSYLIVEYYTLSFEYLYLIPTYFFFILLCFFLTGFVTGSFKAFSESIQNHFFFHQLLGLLLIPLLFVWVLNMEYTPYFAIVFTSLLFVAQLYRWIRGGVFALKHGIKWYYFILYFCTLEIIPIVSIFRYLNFR